MNSTEVYSILKELNKKRILHYIPRKNIPHISFPKSRVNAKDIVIPFEVYEQRKEQYSNRIQSVIDYLDKDETCRNKTLLAYFNEDINHDCGQCDVCQKDFSKITATEINAARQAILSEMTKKGFIMPLVFDYKEIRRDAAGEVLSQMSREEETYMNDSGQIYLSERGKKKYIANSPQTKQI